MCLNRKQTINSRFLNEIYFLFTKTERHSGSNEGNAPYAGQMHNDVKANT